MKSMRRSPELSLRDHLRNSADELAYIRMVMDMYSDDNHDMFGIQQELEKEKSENGSVSNNSQASSLPRKRNFNQILIPDITLSRGSNKRKHLKESLECPEFESKSSSSSKKVKGALNPDEIRDIKDMWEPRPKARYYRPPPHVNPTSEKNPMLSKQLKNASHSRRIHLPPYQSDDEEEFGNSTSSKLPKLKMNSSKNLENNNPLPPIVIREKSLTWIKSNLPGLIAPNNLNKKSEMEKGKDLKKKEDILDDTNEESKANKPSFELFNTNADKIANQILKRHCPLDIPEPSKKVRKRRDSDKRQKKTRKSSNNKKPAKKPILVIPRRLSMPPELEDDNDNPITNNIKVTIKKKRCGKHTTKIETDGNEATFEIEDVSL